jgi:hypothetical protein
MKGFSALWVRALGNHWQLPPLRPAKTNVPQETKRHNEAFVPESGTVVRELLNQLPLDGIHDCLQAVVSTKFLVDMVEMIAEGLRANPQRACNIIAILAFGEQAQDMLLLLG